MAEKSKFKNEERLGYLLKAAQQALRNKMDGVLSASGLTTSQYSVLSALGRIRLPSNADLARECFVTAQTMIRIVRNLEDDGLIRKVGHPTHGKIIGIEMTIRGIKVLKTAHLKIADVEKILVREIPEADQMIMATNLKKMIATLGHSAANQSSE